MLKSSNTMKRLIFLFILFLAIIIATVIFMSSANSPIDAIDINNDGISYELMKDNNIIINNENIDIKIDDKKTAKKEYEYISIYDELNIDIDELIDSYYRNYGIREYGYHVHNYRCGHDDVNLFSNHIHSNSCGRSIEECWNAWILEHGAYIFPDPMKELDEKVRNYDNGLKEFSLKDLEENHPFKPTKEKVAELTKIIEKKKNYVYNSETNLNSLDTLSAIYCINKCENNSYRISYSCTADCVRYACAATGEPILFSKKLS